MNKVSILIKVELAAWEAIPAVARWLSLPSDAQTPEVASMIFDSLVMDAFMEAASGAGEVSFKNRDVGAAVEELLDPNVAVPLTVQTLNTLVGGAVGLTLTEMFDEYEKEDPNDIWVKAVLAKTDDNFVWRLALASTYQVIRGDDRKSVETWKLIEKTYRLLAVDKGRTLGDNPNSPSGEQPLKPSKE